MIITKEIIESIIAAINPINNPSEARKVFFTLVKKNDIVPEKYATPFAKIVVSRLYDKSGKGYKGVINEVTKRLDTIRYTDKIQALGGIPVKEFFLHKQGETDTIDFDNHCGYEEKSGCGDWLKSHNPIFEEVIKEYRRKKTRIRWDYSFTVKTKKAGIEKYHIFVESTYCEFFDFLATYDKGFSTWWKENSKSGETGLFVWELQTINTSKTKADFLKGWPEWYAKNHKE